MENKKTLGLAVVGCGVVGRMRSTLAKEYPGIGWIGLADINEDLGLKLKNDIKADFFTTNFRELIERPEVDAVIVATSTWSHVEPILASVERKLPLLIEKPLATDATESLKVLNAINESGVDAVVGYTQRFRRRFLAVKERINNGQIGEATAVVVRAFMNKMAPTGEVRLSQDRRHLTPMVVSGTHSLDMALWMLGDQAKPVSIFARSTEKIMSELGTKDATFGVFTMEDGTIFSMNICWALPKVWPGAVYGLEIGVVGTKGVIDIEDTHRDVILATEYNQGPAYRPEGLEIEATRNVDFLTSFPPGDIYNGDLWGPIREETNSWFSRIYLGKDTPHATAKEGHRNLVLTMAMDLSAKTGKELELPIDPAELMRGL
ncbi:MAG: oxidoreductase [Cellvibrionales bacterium TMED49]|jgi:predicted dehydrogenase|uniref:Gfo/Idh/MocA family oxidoreductase n=1 Tax=PS1 clade bacterium TaxID=2175152 RepID=A0A368DRC6_9PROT|nr:oxidoreductase [Rhodobiaceae bacterium]OUT75045.1 MAG: oxidoreductase [Rhizobiales bacterium TMED25]OUU40457.1 MAG: oxidoreductase [Cellvibrionales bacterium TMED49]RCL74398.1 MAG: gfo/Idh/MocA family oxidoreductase [PS1 clade bacterium]MAU86836.1 oxidoreductase [Rhodobiaceae bacterium]|tara:strand:- start:26764 stop:27891 length:1128 start_codon:yes stop_codon:yes gene_type:complete